MLERHDHEDPDPEGVAVGGICHVGRRGVRLCVRMAVHHPDQHGSRLVHDALDVELLPPVEEVALPRLGGIAHRKEPVGQGAVRLVPERACEHPTRLEGLAGTGMGDHRSVDIASDAQSFIGHGSEANHATRHRYARRMRANSDRKPGSGPSDSRDRVVATNRQARRNFEVIDTWEAGLVLRGGEVKSLRESKVQIAEAFGRFDGGELWLLGLHISPWVTSGSAETSGHDPDRPKKLLLHRAEIRRMHDRVQREGLTVIALSLYFSNGRAKVELALARGRGHADKRQAIAEREAAREADRAIARNRRR